MSEHVKEVGEADFEAEVLKNDLPVVVDFWAPWCGPCQNATPHFEAFAEKYVDKAKFVKVNIDENEKLRDLYEVKGVPVLLFFKQGKIADISLGFGGSSVKSGSVENWESILKKLL